MKYIVELMGGRKVFIAENEFKNLGGKSGLVFIPSIGEMINLSSVTAVYPETSVSVETDNTLGILYDGTRVIKQFGEWRVMNDNRDEDGHYLASPDPAFYPEVALDQVPSIETFEAKYRALPITERKQLLLTQLEERRVERLGLAATLGIEAKKSGDTPCAGHGAYYCSECK